MEGGVTQPQAMLNLRTSNVAEVVMEPFAGPCALEDENFPFEEISDIAELESWRKEINRPIYHIHKWWAQRLGSVFRAILLGALTPSGTDIVSTFYRPVRLKGRTVFDPFMGSGTTIGEAAKLGARCIGRDINPVAHFLVRNALAFHDKDAVIQTFRDIEGDVADDIRSHYQVLLENGERADVLYYFWVKRVDCPQCRKAVDLFRSRIFAKHAYPKRHPDAKACCPNCGEVNSVRYDAECAVCAACEESFNPQDGAARGQKATCPECKHEFSIAKKVRQNGAPPAHRLYAKLVLTRDGQKKYIRATDEDGRAYELAEKLLEVRPNAYPVVGIEPGHNTNQALGYNYRRWHEMFNARQLLCLSILADRIRSIDDPALRDLFTCLFSGALEFNNLFASFKGEGTGAVRHMFSHHILKPERMPLEANVWGTPKSSGSFMTMFERRICRALEYASDPFELRITSRTPKKKAEKVYGLSVPLGFDIVHDFKSFEDGKSVYLSCGDSSATDIGDKTIDAVITDPPFFDNVHYSQLADFFHVWQRHILGEGGARSSNTTRSPNEVQNAAADSFTGRLKAVWTECHRILSDNGVLAFTYHHSRSEGWSSVLCALMEAGFGISAALPIKAEMSVAVPKLQAKEPIDLDIILVCRKRTFLKNRCADGDLWARVASKARGQVLRLRDAGRRLSRNDVRIIVMAQLIHDLSLSRTVKEALSLLTASDHEIELQINALHVDQS